MVAISWREGRGGEIRASLKLDRERERERDMWLKEQVSSVFGEEVVKLGKGDAGETGI